MNLQPRSISYTSCNTGVTVLITADILDAANWGGNMQSRESEWFENG